MSSDFDPMKSISKGFDKAIEFVKKTKETVKNDVKNSETLKQLGETFGHLKEKLIEKGRASKDLPEKIGATKVKTSVGNIFKGNKQETSPDNPEIHVHPQNAEEAAQRLQEIYQEADHSENPQPELGEEAAQLMNEFFVDQMTAVQISDLESEQKTSLLNAMVRDPKIMEKVSGAIYRDENGNIDSVDTADLKQTIRSAGGLRVMFKENISETFDEINQDTASQKSTFYGDDIAVFDEDIEFEHSTPEDEAKSDHELALSFAVNGSQLEDFEKTALVTAMNHPNLDPALMKAIDDAIKFDSHGKRESVDTDALRNIINTFEIPAVNPQKIQMEAERIAGNLQNNPLFMAALKETSVLTQSSLEVELMAANAESLPLFEKLDDFVAHLNPNTPPEEISRGIEELYNQK